MLLSILVVLGLVGIIALFTFRPQQPQINAVDYATTVTAARTTGAFDVAVPVPVPDGWIANSVRYRPSADDPKIATWHLGFYLPEDQYAAIEQTNGTDSNFIKDATATGKPEGEQTVDGVVWKRYNSASTGNKSLVVNQDGIVTVVTGTISYEQLGDLAASLRTS
jgi:hypothetical protein